mmetsp:Transcript_6900/g.17295  ORF Transcript_6900/g.17295 Transcript_6900/m.17295 type:complete len:169 (-) Transcript_6900:191-697(-)
MTQPRNCASSSSSSSSSSNANTIQPRKVSLTSDWELHGNSAAAVLKSAMQVHELACRQKQQQQQSLQSQLRASITNASNNNNNENILVGTMTNVNATNIHNNININNNINNNNNNNSNSITTVAMAKIGRRCSLGFIRGARMGRRGSLLIEGDEVCFGDRKFFFTSDY